MTGEPFPEQPAGQSPDRHDSERHGSDWQSPQRHGSERHGSEQHRFERQVPEHQTPEWQIAHQPEHPPLISHERETIGARVKKALAPLAGIGALLAKFGAVLVKLKALTVVGSMAVSVAAYTTIWGWKFALGVVGLLLIHEMGHYVWLRARGIKAALPVFVPLLGAYVSHEKPQTAYESAETALAGPAAGGVGAIALGYAAHAADWDLLRSLAFAGFLINLLNLLPLWPLDGEKVAGALHPALWLLGVVVLLGIEIVRPSPILLLLLLVGAYQGYNGWRHQRDGSESSAYREMDPGQRLTIGSAYLGLILVLVLGAHATYIQRHLS